MREHHHPQSYPNSCVPACMCIVQRWRGVAPTEDAFHAGADREGHSIGIVRWLGDVELVPTHADEFAELRFAVMSGALGIVVVSGPPYVRWLEATYPLASPHGKLCPPGTHGRPRHALVVCGYDHDEWLVLDPWFPGDGQPLRMAEDDLVSCFAGLAAVARR